MKGATDADEAIGYAEELLDELEALRQKHPADYDAMWNYIKERCDMLEKKHGLTITSEYPRGSTEKKAVMRVTITRDFESRIDALMWVETKIESRGGLK